MDLIQLVITLIVVVLAVLFWLLNIFGVVSTLPRIQVGK